MKKLIGGIARSCLAFVAIGAGASLGASLREFGPIVVILLPGLFCLVGGTAMAGLGALYLVRLRRVVDLALQMLRGRDKIEASEIARKLSLSEYDVRRYLAQGLRQGIIKGDAQIV
mgnify:CR=1 FL=1